MYDVVGGQSRDLISAELTALEAEAGAGTCFFHVHVPRPG